MQLHEREKKEKEKEEEEKEEEEKEEEDDDDKQLSYEPGMVAYTRNDSKWDEAAGDSRVQG